jgi:hypothetical protein
MVLSVQQRVFLVETYAKYGSIKQCRELFSEKYAVGGQIAKPPVKLAIQDLVKKWRETGSVLNKKRSYQKRVCTPENIDSVENRMFQSPTKSTRRLSQQTGISRTSCRRILKSDLVLKPYKVTVVHELKPDQKEQ